MNNRVKDMVSDAVKDVKKRINRKKKVISYDGLSNRDRTIIGKKTNFTITEAYKTLRTNIIFSCRGDGCKKFVVTSPFPGEGKTTNAINLAISFAQTGKKTLLIDGDMRKPKLSKYFGIRNRVGLSNILSGIYDEGEGKVINKTRYDNLELITAGHIPPNPIELLSSDNMKQFLSQLDKIYDYVVIDTPPVNVVSDALVLSKDVSGFILVVRSDYTEYRAMDIAMSKFDLAEISPLGIILNSFTEKRKKYAAGSKYKYKNYYNYYRYS